jgi:inorganic pyrophosphatase
MDEGRSAIRVSARSDWRKADNRQPTAKATAMSRMTKYMNVSPGTDIPHVVNAIIEIPQGSRSKFELDKETGLFRLDRYLFSSLHYPGDYGLIPQTLAEDGDPLDVLVMVNEPTFTGCLIETRVVGLFKMKDRDANDFKVFGVPNSDPLFKEFKDLDNVPSHFLKEVEHFFATYKELEGVSTETLGWFPAEDAIREVRECVERYRKHNATHAPRAASAVTDD